MKSSYLFLAPGFEEVEALTPVDVMRRAGIDVKTVSVTASRDVEGAYGVTVKADMTFDEADFSDCDWLVLPGGMPGATNLYECKPLCSLLLKHNAEGGHIAAICASPAVVLGGLGLLDGKEATCYPGFESVAPKSIFPDRKVVVSGNIVTANGPSSALVFALAIVAEAMGDSVAKQVGEGMLFYEKYL